MLVKTKEKTMPTNHEILVTVDNSQPVYTYTYSERNVPLPGGRHTMSHIEKVGWECQDNTPAHRRIGCTIKFPSTSDAECPFSNNSQWCTQDIPANQNWVFHRPRWHWTGQHYKYTVIIDPTHKDDPDIQVEGVFNPLVHWRYCDRAPGRLLGLAILPPVAKRYRASPLSQAPRHPNNSRSAGPSSG